MDVTQENGEWILHRRMVNGSDTIDTVSVLVSYLVRYTNMELGGGRVV